VVTAPLVRSKVRLSLSLSILAWIGLGCVYASSTNPADEFAPFEIAMIPDTQNYVDYTHQQNEGFAIDASVQFIDQMQWIADHAREAGGDIVFVASVGDVWQHQSIAIDQPHAERGIDRVENPFLDGRFGPAPSALEIELPKATEGYRILDAIGLPFGVAPGNHDYDAMWSADAFPPNLSKPREELTFTPEDIGIYHVGGLDNFRSVFGNDTPFFAEKPWYVDSFRGGANSAQIFQGGGYSFLHLALEMQADDEVVAWAESVFKAHPGRPTIITTHDYLDPHGLRRANPLVDLDRVDPDHHNSAEELFEKLIRPNDQIFMVLCGHHHGQALRIDLNDAGHEVYQILADYQDRGQSGLDAGGRVDPFFGRPVGIGDGWLRLLRFDTARKIPTVEVHTYSTYYSTQSSELETYVEWYRNHEQPEMSDEEFHAADEFVLELVDFDERFGPPRR